MKNFEEKKFFEQNEYHLSEMLVGFRFFMYGDDVSIKYPIFLNFISTVVKTINPSFRDISKWKNHLFEQKLK